MSFDDPFRPKHHSGDVVVNLSRPRLISRPRAAVPRAGAGPAIDLGGLPRDISEQCHIIDPLEVPLLGHLFCDLVDLTLLPL